MAIYCKLSEPEESRMAAMRKFMRLDNGSFWVHCSSDFVESLFLAHLSFPS